MAAGPFCGMLLADFGAEVIKVEPLEGDTLRQWPPITEGFSENFASLNRGKQSIALDLKNPVDLAMARHLVRDADVLIENNRAGAMERLGLGWDWVQENNPTLIYCSISAYGQSGPRSGEGGFDLTMQAAAGVMSVTGAPDGEPAKCGVPISDFTAGLYAAYSISAALAQLRAGGPGARGCHLDIPMFATTLAVGALQTSEYFGTGRNPRRLGSAHPRNAPYQSFKCADGWFAIAAGNDKLWRSVCAVTATPDLLLDPRFTSPTLRAANQTALRDLLEVVFAGAGAHEWVTRFASAGVPSAPINSYEQALADVQTDYLDLVQPMTLPNEVVTRTVACPVRINGQPVGVDTRPPELNQHGAELRQRYSTAQPAEERTGQ